ncbi:MAG: type IV secretion system DNA-binding domain-containing protein [Patescibacteria group bacterium]|nr:type IV secretion system DNA-binding domain-containing protein [Patescibacteria group bacterium]
MTITIEIIYLALGGVLLLLLFIFIFFWLLNKKRSTSNKDLELEIIKIKIPKYSKKDKEESSREYVQNSLGQIENFFAALSGLKVESKFLGQRTDIFSMEIVSLDGQISFYAAVPPRFRSFFIQQLQAVYPKIYFEDISDYNIFSPQGHISGGLLRFARDFSLPIRTYKSFESDPLESISNSLSKLAPGESAAVQYVFRSAHKSWHNQGLKIVRKMYEGMSFNQALSQVGSGGSSSKLTKTFKFIFSFFQTKKSDVEEEKEKIKEKRQLSAMEQELAKSLEQKTSKSGLDVNIRVITSAPDKNRSFAMLKDILNSYNQYNIYEFGNAFQALIPKNPNTPINNFIYRHYVPQNRLLLNSEEITSVLHLPLPTTETPNIDWLEAVRVAPPANLPKEGVVLGVNRYRGKETLVRIKKEDRRRHMYEIGQTGVGKSTLLESLIKQDIEEGRGVCLVDPHGDLAETVLSHVPKERAEDVIYFNPADVERPLAINMLEFETSEQKTFVINEMISIFDKLYDLKATGGPMFEQYMRNAMLLVMDDPLSGATLMEIPRVLSDQQYRNMKLSRVKSHLVKDFWEKEAQKAGGEAALTNMVPYITSKLTPFLSNDIIRPIIAQQKSAFNFRQVMDEKKIVIINLSKGRIGETNSSLLGMIIIGKILYAALSRVDLAEDQRHDFYLYIDEFQNYTTDSIAIILSEARKYRLNLILAHQFIAQLVKNNDTRVRDAIFGNVGTIISYRIGVDDAEIIAKHMAPTVSEYDLVNMPKYTCYVKLLIDNQNPPAFNFEPTMAPKGNYELAQAIKELSRLKYGRQRDLVEKEIISRVSL